MKQLSRNVKIATLASMLTDISSEMVVYLVPIFLATVLKTPFALVGLIEGVAEATASFTKLFSGYFSDRLGMRKRLVLAGYGLSALVKPLLVIANAWPTVFAVRFVDRLGKGIRTAPRDALIADSTDASQRGAAFGFHRAGDTLGAFIGIALALTIIWLTQQQEALLTTRTFHIVVLVSLIPAILAVIVLAIGIREVRPAVRARPPLLSLKGFDRRFKALVVVVAIFTLGNSTDSFIVLRAQERGAGTFDTLLMVLAFNGVYALLAQPLGKLSDRISRRTLLLVGWFVYALVYIGFALSQTVWQVALLWAIYGLYYALTEGALKALVADLTPVPLRGTAYGLLNATIGIMPLPASLIAGLLWQWQGPWLAFGFGAVLAAVATLLLARVTIGGATAPAV